MAGRLAQAGANAVFSYAGRTKTPKEQPLPTRVGGFGGADGLANFIASEGITHVIDATHPFASQMSNNAVSACAQTGTALCALERAPWVQEAADLWTIISDMDEALAALPRAGARVFLAIGRQNLDVFAAKPGNHYLLRLVDAPEGALPLPDAFALVARGPFTAEEDAALMTLHKITHVVAKNSGGAGAEAKIVAARALGLPVIMIDRPDVATRKVLHSPGEVMNWLCHEADRGV